MQDIDSPIMPPKNEFIVVLIIDRIERGKPEMFPSMDEGDIQMAVYVKNNKLIINFGKDITWIGFNSSDIDILIELLKQKRMEMK